MDATAHLRIKRGSPSEPRRYDDFSALKPISALTYGQIETVIGTLWNVSVKRTRSNRAMITAMLVDDSGRTQDVHVVESAGEVLDRPVLEAVRRWRYEPARKNGVKVKVRLQAKHTFVEPS